ncbi:hypothetical protein [Vitiosangium sp. GDMCC 1.1324]|uniref:hypothetical protein n=1 Tax=Vitiosangium sp. (strain GDMCC 1.1324) TaxID=2138576 RepID=UPI000D3A906D|nr:hypothetical protein [Vitiosangium sp. GDMCC 1.1324]PTL78496.1 hypothetical protein DAT35_38875 [Vitiosangium sp. GDMCC 1.1324]
MSRPIPWIVAGGLAAALTACPTRTPSQPPAPLPIRVPPGCEKSQAGEYHHAQNPAFRYLGEDDGGTLTLTLARAREGAEFQTDGGTAVRIVLNRTPDGFVGETRATMFTPTGTECPVGFPTQATTCDDKGLTLRSVASAAIDEQCRPATNGSKPVWKEQRLLRGAPNAGTPDAGAPDAGTAPPPTSGDAGTPAGR